MAVRRETPEKSRDRQRGLYRKAKREPQGRFSLRQDKVGREAVLRPDDRLERSHGGAPGSDGGTVQSLESGEGEAQLLAGLRQEVKEKTSRPPPVRWGYRPKADGKRRPWGRPTRRDRGAQRAVKLVLEPSCEADFVQGAYGLRPKRDAQQAVGALREALSRGPPYGLDADRQPSCDPIPHEKLRAVIARRVSERHRLRWLKPGLKATGVKEDGEGKRHPPRRSLKKLANSCRKCKVAAT